MENQKAVTNLRQLFFIFQHKKALKNYGKYFLFHLKRSFGSCDIEIFVILLLVQRFFLESQEEK